MQLVRHGHDTILSGEYQALTTEAADTWLLHLPEGTSCVQHMVRLSMAVCQYRPISGLWIYAKTRIRCLRLLYCAQQGGPAVDFFTLLVDLPITVLSANAI